MKPHVFVPVSDREWSKRRDTVSEALGGFDACSPVNCSCHLR